MFDALIEVLDSEGYGIHGFQKCATLSLKRAAENGEAAIPYLLLGVTAEQFVNLYEGQPLPTQVAEAEYRRFKTFADRLAQAYGAGDAGQRMAAVNSVAAEIAGSKQA